MLLGFTSTKLALWQSGLVGDFLGVAGQTPDYTIAGLSFTAALIFFALWWAGRINKEEVKPNALFD